MVTANRILIALLCILGVAVVLTQVQARVDLAALAHIDEHAANTPAHCTSSVQSLAAYLAEPCESDLEKARAIFCWIVLNISYDTDAATAIDSSKQTHEQVLETRKAVCRGYARLFAALAQAMNLKQHTIEGYSKGLRYVSGQQSLECDHAWNAVMLDGEWRLIDCAWGAGHVDSSGRFVRRRCDHFFLTPPEQSIYDHFPSDPKWQLLPEPVSKADYKRLVVLTPEAFVYGLKPISHAFAAITCVSNLEVSFDAPDDVVMIAEVRGADSRACPKASTLVQREGGQLKVWASFPVAGKYILRLYARQNTERGAYARVVDYTVSASGGAVAGFPKAFPAFLDRSAYLHLPVTASLKVGSTAHFRLTVPGAEAVAVVINSEFTTLTRQDDEFKGEVIVSGRKLNVAARYPGAADYSVLLEYCVAE